MENLRIKLPDEFYKPQEFGLDSKPESVRKWLNELPLVNAELSADEVLTLVRELNVSDFPPQTRYQHLKIILPVAEDLCEILRGHYSTALLPLSTKNFAKFDLVTNLTNEMATGFRLIEKQLRNKSSFKWRHKGLMLTCLYLAIQQLSHVLLDYYLVYYPEPAHIWGEINRLYAYAEERELHDKPVPNKGDDAVELTIAHVYKSALLLEIASPYHMMQGEALNLRKHFYSISNSIRLQRNDRYAKILKYVVDLDEDSHPNYISSKKLDELKNPRFIDIVPIVSQFKSLYVETVTTNERQNGLDKHQLDLEHRIFRDTVRRVIDTVSREQDRAAERSSVLGKVVMTIGLSASHFHSSNEAPFRPELDEIRIHTGKNISNTSSLIINPVDFEPANPLNPGFCITRESTYHDTSSAMDIWNQVYRTDFARPYSYHTRDHLDDMKKLMVTTSWTQKNTSEGGMCLFCQAQTNLPVRVGEIVSYCKSEGDPWHVGVIRWLRVHENLILEIGVMHLAEGARSVGCRAIRGTGTGSEYFRCLLANEDINAPDNSIIVPATSFDSGSLLAVNLGDKVHYIKLRRHLLTTKSAAQYNFTVLNRPGIETESIRQLKKMMSG